MEFVTAQTATHDSIEIALDAAFLAKTGRRGKDRAEARRREIRERFRGMALGSGVGHEAARQSKAPSMVNFRAAFVLMCIRDGASITDIAKAMGWSRQHVSRMKKRGVK